MEDLGGLPFNLGNAFAQRGYGFFENETLLEWHKLAREAVTVVLLLWLFPLTAWLWGRLRGQGGDHVRSSG